MASLTETLRTHHVKLVTQVLLLLLMTLLFCYSLINTDWIGTPIISGILILFITGNIIRLVEKSNRDFAQFLNNVSHNDFTTSSAISNQALSARDFVSAQKTLLAKYRKLKADRSTQTEYLQLVLEHVDSALICFDSEGRIEFLNRAATRLLNKKYITSIRTISKINAELGEALVGIRPGENQVLKLVLGKELIQLILSATEFILLGRRIKLVSLKNIKSALDEREIESWQKLIKVLTHEIMNSMTPIVSLSHYIESIVTDPGQVRALQDEHSEQSKDLHQSIHAIASRSKGLMDFVDSYRSLSNLPKPSFEQVRLRDLFERVELLMAEKARARNIDFKSRLDGELILTADPNLLEQVLINLLSNAFDAVAESARKVVELEGLSDNDGRPQIHVTDTGCGISKDIVDNIFTPFYTTKENGSGIGLSLSRQLARLNKGTLSVSSIEGEGSRFTLRF